MAKKIIAGAAAIILASALAGAGFFYWKNLRGFSPATQKPAEDIAELLPSSAGSGGSEEKDESAGAALGRDFPANTTGFPLTLPKGFSISIFAKDLPGARVLLFDQAGDLWVSRTGRGAITKLEVENGKEVSRQDMFRGLNGPHGLAFDPEDSQILYFAEEGRISKVRIGAAGIPQKIADLPSGGGHSTRTLLFGADGRLYVSAGSSCNVCVEKDPRRAKIFSLSKDGSNMREFASGLRNSVFLANHPLTGKIWATDMGRDLLGDDVPPDEINIIEEGGDYGWPYCYGKNIHDSNFDPRGAVSCGDRIPSRIDIQAHSAPLGLSFIPEGSGWPREYENNLIVAFHGSWNRSVPTGYKLVRYRLDGEGNPPAGGQGEEDFISGWLRGSSALGRPVGLAFKGGDLYVSDDGAGVIYKISRQGK